MVIDMNYWRKVSINIIALLLSILAVYLGFKLAIFFMPFLIAFIISLILEPVIRFFMKKTKLKRKTSSIIVFIIALAIIIKRSVAAKKNPYTNEIFVGTKDYEKAMARAE